MLRKSLCAFCLAVLVFVGRVDASLQAVVDQAPGSNDPQALAWLQTNLGVTGLTLLVKEDIGGATTGPAAGAWNLTGSSRAESWTINSAAFIPQYWFVKFNGLIAIYEYMGPGSSPFSDSFNLDTQVALNTSGNTGNLLHTIVNGANTVLFSPGPYTANMGKPNVYAGVSHVSVYGELGRVIPEPGTIFVWSLLALAGIGGSRKWFNRGC